MVSNMLAILVQLFVLLILPPFFMGVIVRVKSIIAGRKGPPLLQLYFDIYKSIKKGAIYSKTTSFIFKAAPLVILASVICAGILIPLTGKGVVDFYGSAILFVYLLALSRFFIIISAMDTGSSFEGMGASREAAFGAFAELTTFIVIITLSIISRSMSLKGMFTWNADHFISDPSVILLFAAFFFILLTENSRMPVDDPNTHLELTMIHEVMILDNSGPGLGIMLYAASIKLFIFMVFAVMLIYPFSGGGIWLNTGILLFKVLMLAVVIGVVESISARIRLIKIPQFLIASFVISLFALIVAVFVRGML